MGGLNGPNGPGGEYGEPDISADDETQGPPRRSRQPLLAVLAILGIILLVLALAINGGL